MADIREPMLKVEERYYDEKCPGCMIDKRKEENHGIPWKLFLYVWSVTLCTGLPIASLFPFIYFMIRDLHIAKRPEDIGFYAGFVGASFMFGRALTSLLWGIIADKYGRKPVILIGIFSVVIFNTLFGLSSSYWMAIASRLLLGSMNGLLGPIKAYAVEVSPAEHQALALSLVSTAWAIGLVVGPAIGGYLAQPAEKYPHVFSHNSLFGRFPYFLPCLAISIFAVGVFISCIWLPETLHFHNVKNMKDIDTEDVENPPCNSDLSGATERHEEKGSTKKENLFKNWPLMSSIILYCIFSLHDMAYSEIFPLWAESDKQYKGLGFSSGDVGQVLSISGSSLLLFQLFVYPSVERRLGSVNLARICAVLTIPLLTSYPFMTELSGFGLKFITNVASVLKNVFVATIITGMFVLQNNAVSQEQRGAANGISMTAMSFFKALAPAGAGAIFSWGQKRDNASFLPGNHMIFFILNVIEFIGFVMTFKPFLELPKK